MFLSIIWIHLVGCYLGSCIYLANLFLSVSHKLWKFQNYFCLEWETHLNSKLWLHFCFTELSDWEVVLKNLSKQYLSHFNPHFWIIPFIQIDFNFFTYYNCVLDYLLYLELVSIIIHSPYLRNQWDFHQKRSTL